MFAVVKTGGKQYRVAKDDVIRVEKLDAEAGATVALHDVLLIDADGAQTVGTPTIEGAAVEAEVVDQMRDKKVLIFKKKRRQNYRRRRGHRQNLTVLKITGIVASGATKPAAAVAAPAPAKKAAAKKATAKKASAKKATAKKATAKKAAAKKADAEE